MITEPLISLPFRFDSIDHSYTALDTGELLPHITGMLARTGWINDRWYTVESSERGTAIHSLTADYDLGALDVATLISRYRGWVLAWVQLKAVLQATMLSVEEPLVHPILRFGGRPDRAVRVDGLKGPGEIKSGAPEKAHQVQTALQAILLEPQLGIPAIHQRRLAFYIKDDGKMKVKPHDDPRDILEARRIVSVCCAA
jgi:hypothetical protein